MHATGRVKWTLTFLTFFMSAIAHPLLHAGVDYSGDFVASDGDLLTRAAGDVAAVVTLPTVLVTSSAGVIVDAASNALPSNYDLSTTYSFYFRGASSSSMTIDGCGYLLQMARTTSPLLVVNDNKSVRLTNIVLKDFSPAHIKLGRNSTLTFGDNVYIQLADNAGPITSSWYFDGMDCVIDGRGKTLQIKANDALLVNDAKQLCLKDLKLVGAGSGATTSRLRCTGKRAQLTFDDVTLFLDPLFNIKQGNLLIKNQVTVKGRGNMLAWTSTGTLTIDSNACLSFDYGTTFSYDSASGSRSQLIMTDLSSVLQFNNACLCATHTGLILSNGSIFFDNLVTVSSEASNEAEAIVFDSSVKAYVPLGATFDVRGKVVYE